MRFYDEILYSEGGEALAQAAQRSYKATWEPPPQGHCKTQREQHAEWQ